MLFGILELFRRWIPLGLDYGIKNQEIIGLQYEVQVHAKELQVL